LYNGALFLRSIRGISLGSIETSSPTPAGGVVEEERMLLTQEGIVEPNLPWEALRVKEAGTRIGI
jgi:hypothetical protein